MKKPNFPYPLLEVPEQLATFNGWTEDVYRDLLALQSGALTVEGMNDK